MRAIGNVLRNKFFRLRWLMATYFPIWFVRRAFLASINVAVGEGATIEIGTVIQGPTVIGKNCFIGPHNYIRGHTRMGDFVSMGGCSTLGNAVIGDYVWLGPFVFCSDDRKISHHRPLPQEGLKGVRIERGARVAGHVMTLPGITIGEGAFVGAYSLVTRDVKPRTIVRGIPAREVEDKHGLLKEEIGSTSRRRE
jgi:acetyltransferase-like isoleucine patch superfamily enzyme